MPAKVISSIVTLLINIAAAIIILVAMLLAMNGYSESDAAWGLGAFAILAFIISVTMSIGAFVAAKIFLKKQFSPTVASLISIPTFSVIGIGLEIVGSLIGVGVAEFVRVNF